MIQKLPSRELVLVGAGHTNMHVARMWAMDPVPDVGLTLISPFGRATYSGMLPGSLAGQYAPDEMEIDLYRFTAGRGIKLIVAEAVGLDPVSRTVKLRDRPPVRFDVCSVGIGSVPAGGDVWRDNPAVLSVKPMSTFRERLADRLKPFDGKHVEICVVGAGAGGVEVTFCLHRRLSDQGLSFGLTLADANGEVPKGYTAGTRRRVREELDRRGITLRTGAVAEGHSDGRLRFTDGSAVPADVVIWTVGAAPPAALDGFDLPKAADGFLAVRPTLQSTADVPVFVVGDTATFPDDPLRKAGVFAVREGPVLLRNIRRHFAGRPLTEYRPQSGFLSILNLGDGRAIGDYLGCSFRGTWVWRWKDYIDRKFMRMYRDYRPMDPKMIAKRAPKEPPAMRCRGCGGKVGAAVLSDVLRRLDVPTGPIVRQGLDRPDDAALLNPDAGPADVLTVDFFQAFLDDPYLVGQVAAINALSDVWATGADPAGAMAMVTVPEGHPRQQTELLYQLLAGALRELTAAGAVLLGGHTLEGPALAIGFTVIGQLKGREPLTKGNLRPGDAVILTKPVGTGVLLAAHGDAKCRAEWMDAMVAGMLQGNGHAAELARNAGAAAVTDVTGFGLAVHLMEMLEASGVGVELDPETIPLWDGVTELSGGGIRSTLYESNRERAESGMQRSDGEPHEILFDPQTSGGLLIGVAEETAGRLVTELRDAGYSKACVIGRVNQGAGMSFRRGNEK